LFNAIKEIDEKVDSIKEIDEKVDSIKKEIEELKRRLKNPQKKQLGLNQQRRHQKNRNPPNRMKQKKKKKNNFVKENKALIMKEKSLLIYNETELKRFTSQEIFYNQSFIDLVLREENKFYIDALDLEIDGNSLGPPQLLLAQKISYPDFYIPKIRRSAAKGFRGNLQVTRVKKKNFES
jgi:hypothetical protein